MRIWFLSFIFGVTSTAAQTFQASQFTLMDTLEKPFQLAQLKGKYTLIDCWFPACPPCWKERSYWILLQKRLKTCFSDLPIQFASVNMKGDFKDWKSALQQFGDEATFPLYSPGSTYEGALVPNQTYPTIRIFTPDGILIDGILPPASAFEWIDFVVFALTQQLSIEEANTIYYSNKNHSTWQQFQQRFSKYATSFREAYNAAVVH